MFNQIKKLTENEYVYSVLAKIIGVFTGLIYSIMYSRYLGAELRGEATVVTNYATLVSLVICLGIYQAYPFYRKQRKKDELEDLYNSYVNVIFGLLIVYFGICLLLGFLLPIRTSLKISLVLIPLMFAIKELNYVTLIEFPKLRNTASIILNLIDIIIVGCLFIFTNASLFWCYFLLISKETIYFVIAWQNLKLPLAKIKPTLKGIIPYIRFGIIPMITVILMEVNYKVDVLMLDGKVSAADVGIYSLGVQLAERLWLIPDALKDILLSKLSKGRGEEEVAKITRISLLAMVLCVALAIVLGKPFIIILFGEEYRDSYMVMLVIIASVISMVFYKMIYSYNVANGKRMINMVVLAVAAIINVALNYVLIPLKGIYGAAIASLSSYTACGIVFLVYFHFVSNIGYRDILLVKKNDLQSLKSIISLKR